MLRKFPFSRLEPEFALRVYEAERAEPALFERFYADQNHFDAMMTDARAYTAATNYGFEVDAHWDLWQWNTDWALRPARVTLSAFSPEFDSPNGENLLVEFGLETQFLPTADLPNPYHYVRGNIQSLLKLTHDLDDALQPEKRLLWTDSAESVMGENFALRLQRALETTA